MTIYDLISNPEFKNKHVLELLIIDELKFQDKTQIIENYDKDLSDSFFKKIKSRYESHTIQKKPIEYVLGYVQFFNRKFTVNENTIIPRPETEYMIESVVEFASNLENKIILMDIGTGSGILGISSYLETTKNTGFDVFSEIFLTDLSEKALKVAKNNFENLVQNKKFNFIKSDLLQGLKNIDLKNNDIILVANLPYIPDETFDNDVEENVKSREPRMAFVGGNDGLDFYRIMFSQLQNIENFKTFLKDKKNKLTMFLEMMTWQVDILRKEFSNIFSFEEVKTFHFNIKIVKVEMI